MTPESSHYGRMLNGALMTHMTVDKAIQILNLDALRSNVAADIIKRTNLRGSLLEEFHCPTWEQLVFGAQCFVQGARDWGKHDD